VSIPSSTSKSVAVALIGIDTPTPFSPELPGESGLGKSTLINTLFENKLFDLEQRSRNAAPPPGTDRGRTVGIESISSGESECEESQSVFHEGID